MKWYGIPYQGRKSTLCPWLMNEVLPGGDVFVDLFAGGCSVTHAALLSRKYRKVICNDINPLPVQLFVGGTRGEYKDRTEWVSREMFHMLKDIDPFIKYMWSFGNNGEDYLYSKTLEPIKRAIHL